MFSTQANPNDDCSVETVVPGRDHYRVSLFSILADLEGNELADTKAALSISMEIRASWSKSAQGGSQVYRPTPTGYDRFRRHADRGAMCFYK
jgi:hypothetical protein